MPPESHPEILRKKEKRVTHSNRRFVLAYLLLVIVPIAGLTGVLKSNSKLTAPTAIGGLWKMHISANNLEALPCTARLDRFLDCDSLRRCLDLRNNRLVCWRLSYEEGMFHLTSFCLSRVPVIRPSG